MAGILKFLYAVWNQNYESLGRAGKFANSRRIQLRTEDKSSEQAPSDLDVSASFARPDEYKGSHLMQAKNEKERKIAYDIKICITTATNR